MDSIVERIDELVPLLRQLIIGEYGIALGGAHAKGVADDESDLDLYVFGRDAHDNAERSRLATAFSPDITQLISWGEDSPFVQGGTDFYYKGVKVECWLRASSLIERTIADCLAGHITREYVTWTTTGFYNHVALSDLNVMKPLDDPSGLLER
ncbi:MAG: nucleotidyltransferase domain-containing protein, partial [Anaerolineae bacterium]